MRLRYLLALALAILASPFILFWAWSSVESSRLDRAFDALEARHEPLDVAAFDPKPVSAEERQASHYYKQATNLIADLRPRWLTETSKLIEDFCTTSDPATRQARETSLKSLEDHYTRAFDALDRATALQANGWDPADAPPRNSLDEYLPTELAQINLVRVARLACSGEGEAAGYALVGTLRLRRVFYRWTGVNFGVPTRHSLQLVLTAGAPPTLLDKLQQEYQQIAGEPGFDAGLQLMRARYLDLAQPGVFSDPRPGLAARRMTPFEAIGLRLMRPARDHMTISELREFGEVIDAARQPWPRKLDEAARLDRTYPRASSRGNAMANLVNPFGRHYANNMLQFWMPRVAEAVARTNASIGAIGVARWRADHHGAMPASLQDLVPRYLQSALIDPYSGGELKYVASADGFKIYSVGVNRRDDGGTWEQRSDLMLARRGDPLDVGIAVQRLPKLPELPESP